MSSEPLTSPCISVCEINKNSGFCIGCFRTRKEIATWRDLDVKDQKELLAQLRLRQGRKKRQNRRKN
tara:strand:- start:3002 stop:3202 length:201 start_codon:yes stop_codon:yes gene_type:complete